MDQNFSVRHQWDSRFWAFIWFYIFVIVLLGFRVPVTDRFFDDVQEPAAFALQLHVWSFGAWLVLLAMQARLAATGRMDLHRTLGHAMLPLAAVMVWSTGLSEIRALRRNIAVGDSGGFSAITASYLLPFIVLVPLAWVARKNPPAHKRLILMATASLCAGAHLRTIDSFNPTLFWESHSYLAHLGIGFGGSILIVCMGMVYDVASRGTLHCVYKVGAPVLFGWYALAAWAYDNESYAELARAILMRAG